MVEVELNTGAAMTLKTALLIYRSTHTSSECCITQHEYADGAIQPGKPIDLEAFIEELRGLHSPPRAQVAKPKDDTAGFIPAEDNLIAENSHFRVWWTPPQTRKLFIAGVPKTCWLPGLVWCGHRRSSLCYMWAVAGQKKPTLSTIVYHPKFGPTDGMNHIHADCRLCLGNMNPGTCTPAEWRTGFYDTSFKTADGLPSKPYEVRKAFKKIGPLVDALRKTNARD